MRRGPRLTLKQRAASLQQSTLSTPSVIRYRGFPAPSHYDVCYAPNIDQTFAAPRLVAMGQEET
jgi:hypothetical protein